jgi:hypothetical protein
MKTAVAALATMLVLPIAAGAQSSYSNNSPYRSGYREYVKGDSPEARYCSALIDRFYTYVSSPYDEYFKRRYTTTVGVAVAQCEQGDFGGGIPTLEKALTDAKVALPPRG